MTLTLEIIAPQTGDRPRQTFTEKGGTLGRAPRNMWVLQHKEVSSQHAVISFHGGAFYIQDTSTNGTCLNSPDSRLVKDRPYPLKSGDQLYIQPYVIGVSIDSADDDLGVPAREASPFDSGRFNLPPSQAPVAERNELDPLDFFKPLPQPDRVSRKIEPPPPGPDALLDLHVEVPRVSPPPPPAVVPAAPPVFSSSKQDTAGIPVGYDPLLDSASDPLNAAPPLPAVASQAPSPFVPPPPRAEAPLPLDPFAPPSPPPAPRRAAIEPAVVVPPPPLTTPDPADTLADGLIAVDGLGPLVTPDPEPAGQRVQGDDADDPVHAELQEAPVVAPPPVMPATSSGEGVPFEALRSEPAADTRRPMPDPPLPGPDVQAGHTGAADGDLKAMLEGAGLHGVAVTPELMRTFGQILRVVVGGTMDVLQARQRIKEEFQMRMTTIKPADNNPLKLSVNVEDALHNLLVKRNQAYLGPVEAFGDAFDDLRHHQLAMLAGMRVAFQGMLTAFDPDRLQEEFDRQAGNAMALKPASMRYWDLYKDKRRAMLADPERAFEQLFGDAFAKAYDEQFRRLKAERRGSSPRATGPAAPPRDK